MGLGELVPELQQPKNYIKDLIFHLDLPWQKSEIESQIDEYIYICMYVPVEEAEERIDREERLMMMTWTVGHLIDEVSVVIVRRQGHGAAERGGVERRIVGWEVRLEIQHGTVLVEDGAEGVQLVTRGVAGGVVEFQEELVVCHIVQSNEAKRTETARFCSNRVTRI